MSLRGRVFESGTYLVLRQGAGMLMSLVSVLLVTRAIGPAAYGVYSAGVGVSSFVYQFAQLGIGVYLVRREEGSSGEDYDQGFSLMVIIMGLILLLGWPISLAVQHWTGIQAISPVVFVLIGATSLQLTGIIPMALLERKLAFRAVAGIEMAGQALYLALAVPLAWAGAGSWAPVTGWIGQQVLNVALLYRRSHYRPRWLWDRSRIRVILRYGLGYSSSIWIWQLRQLVNPLIVGRFAGAEAMGVVALAIRLVDVLSFIKSATWRLSISALAKLQDEYHRLLRAIEEGMRLQVLFLGPILLGFSLLAPWFVEGVFGAEWAGTDQVYPFVAFAVLVNSLFSLHSSALYVLKHNRTVACFHIGHILLFAGAALVLVPQVGATGYGWAEVAALLSYWLIHLGFARHVGQIDYRAPLAWTLSFGLGLFWTRIGPLALLPALLAILWPRTWQAIAAYVGTLRRSLWTNRR